MTRTLVIIPCMSWVANNGDYTKGKMWKKVLELVEASPTEVDIYAIDCIRLKSNGKMIGLWSPSKNKRIMKEILEKKLDNYPAWGKYKNRPDLRDELRREVENKLKLLCKRYDRIISFTNVKVYNFCLRELASKFDIITLPATVDWKAPRSVPYKNIDELAHELSLLEVMA